MGRGAPKGRRGRAAVLRGGAAGATVALARFARQVGAFCVQEMGRGGAVRGGSVAVVLARGSGLRAAFPADRGSVSTGHAVSLRTARAVRGERARAAFLRTVTGPRRPLRGETASARSSRPAPLPPPASGQEMAGDRVVSVAGDLPCERMRPRAGVCQSLFLRDWVFLPSSIIILKVTAVVERAQVQTDGPLHLFQPVYQRVAVDVELARRLGEVEAVLKEGPRWCGASRR